MNNPPPDDEQHDNDNPELDGPAPTPSEIGMGDMGQNVICVSLNSLSMPDEQDKMEAPSKGDHVQASIEGDLVNVEGDKAYVKLTAVNGQEVEEEPAQPTEQDDTEQMRGMAMAQDAVQPSGY